MLPVSKK